MLSLRAMRDAENDRRRALIQVEEDAESSSESSESSKSSEGSKASKKNIRPAICVLYPSIAPLTEETLLQLEQSQPRYRLAQRNLNHWFYYLESTIQDTFDTFANISDKTYNPASFTGSNGSILSLADADFQESHVSPPSSADIFGLTTREPLPNVEVVIRNSQSSAGRTSSSLDSSSSSWNPLPPSEEPIQPIANQSEIRPQAVKETPSTSLPRTDDEFWERSSQRRTSSLKLRSRPPAYAVHIIISDSE